MPIALTRLTAGLSLTLLVAGCATLQNTLAQELAWERWQQCSGKYPTVTLKEITREGQIWLWNYAGTDWAGAQECLRRAADDQAKRRVGVAPAPQDSKTLAIAAPVTDPWNTPKWRRGYEWAFRWESPRGRGTFVWSVDRIETLEGVDYYVVKSGQQREIYWRTRDLAYYMDKVDGEIETRHTMLSDSYPWPLKPGTVKEYTRTAERPRDRTTDQATFVCRVESYEKAIVPAGEFDTAKIVCVNKATSKIVWELWYSPRVKHWVRERQVFDYGVRERELTAYRAD